MTRDILPPAFTFIAPTNTSFTEEATFDAVPMSRHFIQRIEGGGTLYLANPLLQASEWFTYRNGS